MLIQNINYLWVDRRDVGLGLKGIGTPVEKIIQSVDLFFPVRLIVSLIVYQHVNYFFSIFRSPFMLRGDI